MQVGLKIWRYDAKTGDKALREYEVDAPEEATLLDCLDIVKDRHDGSLSYRKSCRMMICGSCGMRMDGAAVLACKMRMYDVAQAGHVPVISAMGNLPIVKDLVVDMKVLERARRFLDSVASGPNRSRYGYQEPTTDTPTRSAVGLLCRYYADGWGPNNPGMAAGVGYLLVFATPTSAAGTLLALVAVVACWELPVTSRAARDLLSRSDRSVEDAAISLGAGDLTTFTRIVAPTLRPAAGWIFGYLLAAGVLAVGTVIVLGPAGRALGALTMLTLAAAGATGTACAVAAWGRISTAAAAAERSNLLIRIGFLR